MEEPVQLPKFRLDGTLTLGNVIQIAVIAGGFLLYYGATVEWKTSMDSWRAETEKRLATTEASGPKVTAIEASDKLQDERIAGVKTNLDTIQRTLETTNKTLSDVATTVAVIEERTKTEKPN